MTERERIEELHQRYLSLRENTPLMKRNGEECRAYHEWYDNAYVYFKSFEYLQSDSDFQTFVNAEKDGNCFVLAHIYDSISPSYKVLMNRIANIRDTTKFDSTEKKPKIFISHNEKDEPFAKALTKLLLEVGIQHKDIFCSSFPGFGVPMGDKIIETIKSEFDKHQLIVLFIHSPRFYMSHVSLCEMGAAWILGCKVFSFLTKDCSFNELTGVIKADEMVFRAGQTNTYHTLNDFKDYLSKKFPLSFDNTSAWESLRNDFIQAVDSIQYTQIEVADKRNKKKGIVPYTDEDNTRVKILKTIENIEEASIHDISRQVKISSTVTSRLVSVLCQEGLIKANGKGKNMSFSLVKK